MKVEIDNLINKYLPIIFRYSIKGNIIDKNDFTETNELIPFIKRIFPCKSESLQQLPNQKDQDKINYPKNGYFRVRKIGSFNSAQNESILMLLYEIAKRYDGTQVKEYKKDYGRYCGGFVWIKIKYLDEFYKKYFLPHSEMLDFPYDYFDICWTKEIIKKYKCLLRDVSGFIFNPELGWTVDDLDEIKNHINWIVASSVDHFKWDCTSISRYRNYLIFSKSCFYKGKGKYLHSYPNIRIPKGNSNEIQKNYSSVSYVSISSCKWVNWNSDLIRKFRDYWDWSELCSNEAIRWTDELIEEHKELIDFTILSSNENVEWTSKLIRKYEEKWCWKSLSGNEKLPWGNDDVIRSFMSLYADKWTWIPQQHPCYCFKKHITELSRSDKIEDLVRLGFISDKNELTCKSISTNRAIIWDQLLVAKFEDKLSFWWLAFAGKFNYDVVYRFANRFSSFMKVCVVFYHYSDERDNYSIYSCGWSNLARYNKNFRLRPGMIEMLQSIIVNAENDIPYGGYHNINQHHFLSSALELFINCNLEEFTLTEILTSNEKFGEVFINNTFINEYFWDTYIKPHIAAHKNEFLELVERNKTRILENIFS